MTFAKVLKTESAPMPSKKAKKPAPAMAYRKIVEKSEQVTKAASLANALGTFHCN